MYKIWTANKFNDDILQKHITDFEELQKAKDFVEYQADKQNENYVIMHNGERIEL